MAGEPFRPDPSWPSILELAIKLWGLPTDWSHNKNEVRFGAHQSKSNKINELVWFDNEANEGGGYRELHQMAIGPLPARPKANGANGHAGRQKPWENIGVVYHYHDADGALILDVIRTIDGNPRFFQRRPDGYTARGDQKWKWNVRDLPGHDLLVYRLPGVLASGEQTIWICEGEKDCDNLTKLGLIATCNIGGSGKWRDEMQRYFLRKHVVVLADNDAVGEAHAATVARSLYPVAASIKLLLLPNLPPKGDVTDWLDAGGTVEGLEYHAREAPPYVPPAAPPLGEVPPDDPPGGVEEGGEPPEPPPPEGDGRGDPLPDGQRVIVCVAGELPRMVRQAQEALLAAGAPIYQRGMLVQPTEQEYRTADGGVTHSAALVPITAPALMKMLSEVAVWQKWDGRRRAFVVCDPPDKLVQIVLNNRSDWPFPHVRGVLTSPTLRPDGSLLMTPGYDPVSRYYLMFPSDLVMPEIPEAPTEHDARESLGRLNGLLDSYPFVNRASRSVALTMLKTQVLRCAMPVSPLLAVSARAPGTGKSHLVDLASTVAIGRPCPAMGTSKKDEETEKGINAMLIAGVPGFSIDNVSRDIDTPTLNMATERPLISIRLFGVLEIVEIENAVVIYMTGNNLAIVDEQGRRTMRCDLDAGEEHPERRPFDGDPIITARRDRGRYIADVLIIARAYHVSQTKLGIFSLGSYGAWLGETDPAETMETTAKDDPATIRLAAMLEGWYAEFQGTPKTIADAVKDSKIDGFYPIMKEQFPARGGAEVDTARMQYWLRKYVGRVAAKKRFLKDDGNTHGAIRWYVEKVE
jgi:putative DNA primase/helicase